MAKKEKPADINELPPKRQKKVRIMRGKLKRGRYTLRSKVVDDKLVEPLLEDIMG